MNISQEEIKQRIKQFKTMLKQSGLKLTHQRIEIIRELVKSEDHPDAESIYKSIRKRIPTVSLDTVYRTLWMLLDLDLISTLGPLREKTRFDANILSHHHFVCSKCGMIRDFYSIEFDNLKIPDRVQEFGSIVKTQVEIKGICLKCLVKTGNIKG